MIRIALGIILAVLVLKFCGIVHAGEINISTGPSNLAYYAAGKDIQKACPELQINIYESKGGVSNIGTLFTSPTIGYGIAPLDSLKLKEITDRSKISKIVVLAPLYMNAIQVIAGHRTGIKTIKDLEGKRVNIGPIGSGSWASAQLIQARTGIKFTAFQNSTAESLKLVMSGELDACFYFSGVPTPDLVKLGKDGDGIVHLVNMRHANLDNFYTPTDIPENTYAWEHNAVQVQQVQNYLIAYNYQSPEKQQEAANLVTCLKNKLDWLAENGNPIWRGVDLNAEVKWPMHEKAKQILNQKEK